MTTFLIYVWFKALYQPISNLRFEATGNMPYYAKGAAHALVPWTSVSGLKSSYIEDFQSHKNILMTRAGTIGKYLTKRVNFFGQGDAGNS